VECPGCSETRLLLAKWTEQALGLELQISHMLEDHGFAAPPEPFSSQDSEVMTMDSYSQNQGEADPHQDLQSPVFLAKKTTGVPRSACCDFNEMYRIAPLLPSLCAARMHAMYRSEQKRFEVTTM